MLAELGPAIASAQVLVRIYELPEDDEDLVLRITQATNSQNPVDLRDLKSNDARQQQLLGMISELGYSYRRQRSESAASTNEVTNATVAEAVLAIWRKRPHQARFLATEHFGKLYDHIFSPDLNGAQAVIAVLLLRYAESRRKRPPEGSPEFLQYGSRSVAMLMGTYLLHDLTIPLEKLTHVNFMEARVLTESRSETYYQQALGQIGSVLAQMYSGHPQPLSLQKLSAAFRRGDLVTDLLGAPLQAQT